MNPGHLVPSSFSRTVLVIAASLLLSGAAVGEGWLQWGGPDGDFTVAAGALAESWPAEGPKQLWRRPLGKGYSSILYQDGRLFTLYRDGDEEIVVALDARTGVSRWEHRDSPKLWRDMSDHFGNGPNATPLIIGDRIVAIGIAGLMRCLDTASGELLWQYDLPRELGRRRRVEEYGYSASLLPYDGSAAAAGLRSYASAFEKLR